MWRGRAEDRRSHRPLPAWTQIPSRGSRGARRDDARVAAAQKVSGGLCLGVAREVAADHPAIDFVGTDAAVFEATHGSSPTYAGRNRVSPTALMPPRGHRLDHLAEHAAARALEHAIAAVIRRGDKVTYDLKPTRTDRRRSARASSPTL